MRRSNTGLAFKMLLVWEKAVNVLINCYLLKLGQKSFLMTLRTRWSFLFLSFFPFLFLFLIDDSKYLCLHRNIQWSKCGGMWCHNTNSQNIKRIKKLANNLQPFFRKGLVDLARSRYILLQLERLSSCVFFFCLSQFMQVENIQSHIIRKLYLSQLI